MAFGLAYQDFIFGLFPFVKGTEVQLRGGKLDPYLINDPHVLADRGANLEDSFKRLSALDGASLKGWESLVADFKMPAAILNATIVETGERLLLSTTEIGPPEGLPVRGRVHFHDHYLGYDVDVTAAARLSATFPARSQIKPRTTRTFSRRTGGPPIQYAAHNKDPVGGRGQTLPRKWGTGQWVVSRARRTLKDRGGLRRLPARTRAVAAHGFADRSGDDNRSASCKPTLQMLTT